MGKKIASVLLPIQNSFRSPPPEPPSPPEKNSAYIYCINSVYIPKISQHSPAPTGKKFNNVNAADGSKFATIPPIYGETLFFWGYIDGSSKEGHCSSCLSNHHYYRIHLVYCLLREVHFIFAIVNMHNNHSIFMEIVILHIEFFRIDSEEGMMESECPGKFVDLDTEGIIFLLLRGDFVSCQILRNGCDGIWDGCDIHLWMWYRFDVICRDM